MVSCEENEQVTSTYKKKENVHTDMWKSIEGERELGSEPFLGGWKSGKRIECKLHFATSLKINRVEAYLYY